ncbi:hypothetical protein E4Z66_02040 [Aliishimia ponticola]|uniref:Uncharacterized protein n=1 Tax=Aliishimia ponticola TaxID=2499833 RepID=A0A4S4NFK7_9RHOB|nr:hypothetical protein [Aliishimia ponticola]THH38374.1 hypothetical protein E4Z66_02040 [Aliishimia ponticola]
MTDKRFEERLKRIAARTAQGAEVEMLAGVGETEVAVKAAAAVDKPRASLVLALAGAIVGFAAFRPLRDLVGIDALMTMPPETLLEIGTAQPMVGGAAIVLGLCALLSVFSLLRGRKAFKLMSFSWAALGAAFGGAIVSIG